MDGLLLVDKPEGISSFGVVAKVRRIISQAEGHKVKIGHCGTLDPAASGLMLLVIGKYTKKADEFSKMDKTYEAEVTLGATSTTADREGELTETSDKQPTNEQIKEVLKTFVGKISQTPPIYSAIKIDGQRAYKLARAGQAPEMKSRRTTIYSLELTDYNYPKLKLTVEVSSGTYIRSLAEDIGKALGTGAYLSALRRIKVGESHITSAIPLEAADFELISQNLLQGL